MQETENNPADEQEISLLDLLISLGEGKWMIAGLTSLCALLGVAVALLLPPMFTGKTVLMPPQQQQSAAASALASLGGLAGLAGLATGIKSPDDTYVALLKSDRLTDVLIKAFDLKNRYESKYLADARKEFASNTRVTADKKSGLITVEVDDKDPGVAANMANRYVEELRKLLGTLAVTEAQQRRTFFEQQVTRGKEQLAQAEFSFKQAQQKSGMQVTQALAESGVRASVELRVQIASREVQVGALRGTYATAQNPDVIRLTSELSALRGQLDRLEKGSQANSSPAQGAAAPTKSNADGQEAVRAYRDVKVQEAILEVMVRQYELARVDEAREGPLVQQVDVARPAERRTSPKRTLIVAVSLLLGFLLGTVFVLVRSSWRNASRDGETAGKMQSLRKAWRLGRS